MKKILTRPRIALALAATGIVLMGADLMVTRSLFIHVGELMAASLLCFVSALVVDRGSAPAPEDRDKGRERRRC
jgi:hypothetical protein